MDWPNETVLDFLEMYEAEPIIWNASLPNHKNRDEVFDAWKRIESKMGHQFSVTDLKKKKDSLMASFRTCLKKIRESVKSGARGDDVYKPNWFAFAKMAGFLRDKDTPRGILNSEAIQYENDERKPDLPQNSDFPEIREFTNASTQTDAIAMPSGPEDSFKNPPTKKRKFSEETDLRKKTDNGDSTLQSACNKPAMERSVCDIYGELVAAKLKALDESRRDICMHRIDNVMFEMKMNTSKASDNDSYNTINQMLVPSPSTTHHCFPPQQESYQQTAMTQSANRTADITTADNSEDVQNHGVAQICKRCNLNLK
ncbi:uncharacterized protein LOC106673737 [Cimex lectularius]|uniref:MADF domain-containing protein n=1 Tax=Cimex lectularius TaxID=79782 RepID=A0A8I6SHF4_CIMLE|nr:uncharacterized protein LOC106673737 [Cimex lectularius]